jgi:hypothetical protein
MKTNEIILRTETGEYIGSAAVSAHQQALWTDRVIDATWTAFADAGLGASDCERLAGICQDRGLTRVALRDERAY